MSGSGINLIEDLFNNFIAIIFAAQLPWPRTQTESLLSAMFEGSSAQFFAIMMTLADSRKRILNTSPAVNEEEDVEGADVYNELFFAAQEIIGGLKQNLIYFTSHINIIF